MKRSILRKKPKSFSPSKKLLRGLAIIFLCCLLVRAIAETSEIASPSSNADTLLKLGLGAQEYSELPLPALALMAHSSLFRIEKDAIQAEPQEDYKPVQSSPKGVLYYHSAEKTAENGDKDFTSVLDSCQKVDYLCSPSQIRIKNNAGVEFSIEELLAEKPDIDLSEEGPSILIIHTHASEAYTPDGEDIYTESDPYRTEDRRYNVVALGDILADALKEKGINVIHNRGIYDYPSYAGSYNRTLTEIENYLEKYPSISMVIDLHRDASESGGSLDYKTTVNIGSVTSSQVMLVVGSNASGLEHPDWNKNLQFAVHLQAALQSRYPGLARPISISKYRYNQHATSGSLILEIGYCGNTLQEARNAVGFFADAAADVILSL